ncbi:rhodanese-like/PpiC domain-containing protein 12, chloroplastic [Impatiens glandulifera]|uniref:rhodanese-like/PpiC domain-containing protein 12, chloroplastic n=1 Tax=Impatiens glandulifera TaxID=253017 RepID=UPI001FB086F5|nr:rhodanese-like/PpiC domain-containing protein 12, chloroplastic [Impatiens glandulifera]
MRSICQQLFGASSSSHLPLYYYASSPATAATFRSSLLVTSHNFVSSLTLNLQNSSGFSIPSKTSLPRSHHLRFFGFKRLPSMAPAGRSFSGVKASFSSESSSSGGDREILVQHLLVKEEDSKIISEIQKRIVQGEDLSDLAVEYSICPSKESGGSLGWVRRGQMVPEFEEAAFGAPINKVVRCKTKFGWHLLQVLSEREESILKDIHPNELHEKLQDLSFLDEAQLIDVREPDEVAQASLPGFVVLPLRQFGSWGPEITTKFDSQKDTYVMCHHGVRSLQVAKWLQTQGFTKVYNVAGGIHAYAANADPSIPTY